MYWGCMHPRQPPQLVWVIMSQDSLDKPVHMGNGLLLIVNGPLGVCVCGVVVFSGHLFSSEIWFSTCANRNEMKLDLYTFFNV